MATWQMIDVRSAKSAQAAVGESAPSLPTEGMSVDQVGGFNLYAEADAGQTFTGTGSFPGYAMGDVAGWARADEYDSAVVVADAGNRRIFLGAMDVKCPRGRVAHVASNVGVTGGGITLYYEAVGLYGQRI